MVSSSFKTSVAIGLTAGLLATSAAYADDACEVKGMNPSNASTQATGRDNGNGFVASLHECIVRNGRVDCQFVAERNRKGSLDYSLGQGWVEYVKLIDNENTEHKALRAYFLDGRCNRMKSMNLGEGDFAWFKVEFENGDSDVDTAKIFMPFYGAGMVASNVRVELRGKVEK